MTDTHINRFSGFSALYHKARPVPPAKICTIILNYLGKSRAGAVVDLGCGTGLSTAIWSGYAKTLCGVEPNSEMRGKAAKKYKDVTFIDAKAEKTGLGNNSQDVITCSQSFHWMDPVAVLREADRILKAGGIFAVYDNQWPVSIGSTVELAYRHLFKRVAELSEKYKYRLPLVKQCPKSRHLANMENSRVFSYCRQVFFDNTETCSPDRFINMAMSQGGLQTLLKHDIPGIEQEIDIFSDTVRKELKRGKKMTVSYCMNLGQKRASH